MRLIESKAEYIPQENGLVGIHKVIELAGRTAYKSEDKITPDSAKGFVDRMIKSNHGTCLEHGTVYLHIFPSDDYSAECIDFFMHNAYSKCTRIMASGYGYIITTNYRVIVENNIKATQYLCAPTEYHEKRYTMKFTCDRGVSHELVRHRVFSFLQESTRYCNYSKDKFNKELVFIKPSWKDDKVPEFYKLIWVCEKIEEQYMEMLEWGATPQQARQILPNALKTEIIMTGFASDWRHFFDLRLFGKTGAPHPDMKLLAEKAQKAMQEAGIWDDIMSKESKFK